MTPKAIETSCCIVGGGPAGLMLGLLLARAGVDVVVLEKHEDFLRDFRGDTIHPSTMEVLHELGYLTEFLRLPYQAVPRLRAQFGEHAITAADFSKLAVQAKFIAMMPQWDFLNFLADKARAFKNFGLLMQTEAITLVESHGNVVGVCVAEKGRTFEIRADLVVAADGRGSVLRAQSGLAVQDFGAPMDALWFRLSRLAADTADTQGRFESGRIFIMLNRRDYWQCAFIIPKGWNDRVRAAGIEAFQHDVGGLIPFAAERTREIRNWEQVKLLTVQVNRMPTWWRDAAGRPELRNGCSWPFKTISLHPLWPARTRFARH